MKILLEQYLQNIGYKKIATNLPEFSLFFQANINTVEVVSLIEDRPGLYLTSDQYTYIKERAKKLFQEKGYNDVHIMTLILADDFQKARDLSQGDRFCWMIERKKRSLVAYENQVEDFYGLRKKIENFLEESPIDIEKYKQVSSKRGKKISPKAFFNVTNLIIAINILIFVVCTFTGDLLYNIGVVNLEQLLVNQEYYRLVTSIFLHADMEHIIGNMLVLFLAGKFVEKILGHVRFTVLYLFTGILGSVFSLLIQNINANFYTSLGASGAVFGVLGALLFFVAMKHDEVHIITGPRLLFYLLYSIYIGFRASNIDNYAHVGGLLSGIFLAFVLWLTVRKKKGNKVNED